MGGGVSADEALDGGKFPERVAKLEGPQLSLPPENVSLSELL
jgi:hypothetical protein